MILTSAEAAKELRRLNEEFDSLLEEEKLTRTFLAATTEDVEAVRPKYNYDEVQKQLSEIEGKIRKLKHAISLFNTTHIIPGFNMTVDEMLVYIPQLSRRKGKLATMRSQLPKTRQRDDFGSSSVIDYKYANYDIEKAKEDYDRVSDLLSKAQTALDLLNSTETFTFEY